MWEGDGLTHHSVIYQQRKLCNIFFSLEVFQYWLRGPPLPLPGPAEGANVHREAEGVKIRKIVLWKEGNVAMTETAEA